MAIVIYKVLYQWINFYMEHLLIRTKCRSASKPGTYSTSTASTKKSSCTFDNSETGLWPFIALLIGGAVLACHAFAAWLLSGRAPSLRRRPVGRPHRRVCKPGGQPVLSEPRRRGRRRQRDGRGGGEHGDHHEAAPRLPARAVECVLPPRSHLRVW